MTAGGTAEEEGVFDFPLEAEGLDLGLPAGSGGGAVNDSVVSVDGDEIGFGVEEDEGGEMCERKVSTSGWRDCLTLSNSDLICVMVFSSVGRCGGVDGVDSLDLVGPETWLSPPPMMAIVEFSLIP